MKLFFGIIVRVICCKRLTMITCILVTMLIIMCSCTGNVQKDSIDIKWAPLSKGLDGETWSYAPNSKVKKNNAVEVLWKREKAGEYVRHDRVEIYCQEMVFLLLSSIKYDDKGRVVSTTDYKLEQQPIVPDTTVDELRRAVCH